jgi:hypothetical protein
VKPELAAAEATEAGAASVEIESEAAGGGASMEAIVERDNLRKALAKLSATTEQRASRV